MDEFIEQLTWSRKSAQRLGLEGIGRIDLWDEENKRVKAKWDVILQQERRKEDEARLSRGGSLNSRDDDDAIVEAPKLIEAEIGGDKFELVQKQVQQQSIVLAQVANSFKESTEKTRDKLGEQNADLKKFQTSVIDALKSHSHRIERIEGAIEASTGSSWRRWAACPTTPRRARTQLAPALDRLPIRTWPRRRTTCGWAGGRTRVSPSRGGDPTTSASRRSTQTSRTTTALEGSSTPRARRRAAGRGRGRRRRRRRCKGTEAARLRRAL